MQYTMLVNGKGTIKNVYCSYLLKNPGAIACRSAVFVLLAVFYNIILLLLRKLALLN